MAGRQDGSTWLHSRWPWVTPHPCSTYVSSPSHTVCSRVACLPPLARVRGVLCVHAQGVVDAFACRGTLLWVAAACPAPRLLPQAKAAVSSARGEHCVCVWCWL